MKKRTIVVPYFEFNLIADLPDEDRMLLAEAKIALKNAYAPYSDFLVGAAVLLEDGTIVRGNNQENVAFPSGLCAERVALFAAGSMHPAIPVKAVAITAKSKNFKVNIPVSPCGACRQVMIEYENRHKKNIRIILQGGEGKIIVFNSGHDLLPMAYSTEDLKR